MLVLLGVTAFPTACLGFVLWMGALEESIPAGVRRAVRKPDPPPVLAVPVRRTPAVEAAGWWDAVVDAAAAPHPVPQQRTTPAALPTAVLPESLAGT